MENMRKSWFGWTFVLALVLSIAAVGLGSFHLLTAGGNPLVLAAGIIGLVVTIAAWGISCQIAAAGKLAATAWEQFSTVFIDRMEQFSVMINVLTEQQLLSDRGKSVAFRDKDREALNRAIREEMGRGQYDAALILIADMENTFGYKQQADELRGEIAAQREQIVRRVVSDATAAIDRAATSEKWDEAMAIATRVAEAYPDHEAVLALQEQIHQRKENVKQQLLTRWQDAVARKDIDASIDLLRQLDMYVTPEEVKHLKDGALEIFKARIEHLREEFKQCVHDKKWNEAMQAGDRIMEDFPTSKLAQEVRDMQDMLKTRAADAVVAAGA